MKAIRGAVRVDRNDRETIFRTTQQLLRTIEERNDLDEEDVLSAFFTMTPDLNADFPAYAARAMGWTDTAMLGAQETAVPGALDRTVRVLIHARGEGSPRHVYLGEAAAMRPDLAEEGDAEPPLPGADDDRAATPDSLRFGTLVVVGVGLIGGSAALALRRRGLFRDVWGLDRDPRAREQALRAGAVDRAVAAAADDGSGAEQVMEALAQADVLLLALPVDALVRWLGRWGQHVGRGTVVVDVASTKRVILRAMETLPEGVEAVGAHPMAGSTESGMGAARPDLFHGAPWALVETDRTGDRAREMAEAIVRAVGARSFWTDAAPHDRATAATSHLPYLLAATLAHHLDERSARLPVRRLRGPGARDMTRLAASDPEVMAGILATNWSAVREEVASFSRRLEDLVAELDGRTASSIRERLEGVQKAQRRLSEPEEHGDV